MPYGEKLPWFRFYVDFRRNPKIKLLHETFQLRYIDLMCLRREGEIPGASMAEIAYEMRITEDELAETITVLESANLWYNGDIVNWDNKQFESDCSTERVKRFRKRRETVSETPSDTDADTDTEEEDSPAQLKLTPEPPPFIGIPIKPKKGIEQEHPVTESDVIEYEGLYGNIDVRATLRRMRGHWMSKPGNQRKTSRGIRTSINSWLAKDDGRARAAGASERPLAGTLTRELIGSLEFEFGEHGEICAREWIEKQKPEIRGQLAKRLDMMV